MNKIIKTIFISAALMLVISCAAFAAQEWNLTATENAATATLESGTLRLCYDEGDAARSAAAERTFDFSGNKHITVSFTANVSGFDGGTKRKLYFRESSLVAMETVSFDENKFSVLGTEIPSVVLSENNDYRVTVGIDAAAKTMVVYLNDEKVFDGSIEAKWKKGFKIEALKVYIRNYTTKKEATAASEFILKNISVGDSATDIAAVPADGAEFVEAASLSGIDLSFNGAAAPQSYASDNFLLTADGSECAFSAERTDGGLKIVPDGGFMPETVYGIKAIKVYDVFGNTAAENKSSGFKTAPADYRKPTVTLTADKTEILDSQTALLTIAANSQNGIDRIEMYVNDELRETFYGDTEFDFYAEKGNYTVFLIAYDSLGGSSESDKITITVKKNVLPVIKVDGVKSGVPITADKLSDVRISVSDSDGTVVSTEVYLGDELVAAFSEGEFGVDLSGAPLGRSLLRIIAEDNSGETAVSEISLVVTGESNEKIVFESDFEDYVSDGSTFVGGAFYKGVMEAGAAIRSSNEYGDEHGTVVEYACEGEDARDTWIYFNTYNTTQSFMMEMDTIILSEKSKVSFYFKDGSSIIDPLTFEGGKLVIGGINGKTTVDFPAGEWHNLRILANMNDHVFSVWIDDEAAAENCGLKTDQINIETRISLSPQGETDKTGIVFDNLSIRYYEQPVQIVGIGYDDEADCMEIAPSAAALKLALSSMVDTTSISKKTVLLYCGGRQMDYESIKCSDGKTIVITLKEKLKSKNQYRAELTNKVMDASGNILKNGAVVNFSAAYDKLDVKKASFEKSGGSVKANATLINTTGESMSCYAVLTVLSGAETKRITVRKITVPAGRELTTSIGALECASGERAELYFRKSLIGQAITDVYAE